MNKSSAEPLQDPATALYAANGALSIVDGGVWWSIFLRLKVLSQTVVHLEGEITVVAL